MIYVSESLKLIQKYCRKPVSLADVQIFTMNMCDNDVDQDREMFSDNAMISIAKQLEGKTGYVGDFLGRIYKTEIRSVLFETKLGVPKYQIRAWAFIHKTPENKEVINAIKNSMPVQASISCSVNQKMCALCGSNKLKNHCACKYGYTILDDVTEVYEWRYDPLLRGKI